jgi:hypothetical protein
MEPSCDRATQICAAIAEVSPELPAVRSGPVSRRAGSQGAAIVQFVRRAIGPREPPSLVCEN